MIRKMARAIKAVLNLSVPRKRRFLAREAVMRLMMKIKQRISSVPALSRKCQPTTRSQNAATITRNLWTPPRWPKPEFSQRRCSAKSNAQNF